jgi:hypothetical protein
MTSIVKMTLGMMTYKLPIGLVLVVMSWMAECICILKMSSKSRNLGLHTKKKNQLNCHEAQAGPGKPSLSHVDGLRRPTAWASTLVSPSRGPEPWPEPCVMPNFY